MRAALQISEENDDDSIPLSAYKPDGINKLEQTRESNFVETAQLLASHAKITNKDGYKWHKLFQAVITGRLESASYG
jgi:hypothetical protein